MNDSPPHAPAQAERRVRLGWLGIVLSLAWTIAWFYGLDGRSLGEPDEGRYAEVAREMVATNDWLTPRLDGFNFFDKPAMHYWGSAAAYSVFGVHEWTARLWCALTGLLAMMAIGWSGTRLFGHQAVDLSAAPIARIVEPGMGPRTKVFTVNMSLRGLPFYLQRLVTVAADTPDDLMPGIASRPEGYIAELGQFAQRWRAGNDEIAVMPLDSLVHLQDTGLPFRELRREGNYVVITRNTQSDVVDTVK